MKKKISESIQIPEGVQCEYHNHILKCRKDSTELSQKINIPSITVRISQNEIFFECEKGNKNNYKIITSLIAHMKNTFHGLNEKYIYKLESCNVHFPMTLKVDKNKLIVNNFLGEKTARTAEILPGVIVEVKGALITISSNNKESAGQTAANFETATKVTGRDRRVYQDGIFIVEKPGRNI